MAKLMVSLNVLHYHGSNEAMCDREPSSKGQSSGANVLMNKNIFPYRNNRKSKTSDSLAEHQKMDVHLWQSLYTYKYMF